MHLAQVGEAALGEGPEQVQRRRRLVVGLEQAGGVGGAGGVGEADVVDDVAPERRQLDAVDRLGAAERGLANWPAMRPTFTVGTPEE